MVTIALLRGINVGGRNSLKMVELRELLETLGCQNVATHIQSGNVVFTHPQGHSDALAASIADTIEVRKSFRPEVLLISAKELADISAQSPFGGQDEDPRNVHIGVLKESPTSADEAAMQNLRKESESFLLTPRVFYLHAPDGVGRSKLFSNAEKLIGVSMTVRNLKTIRNILELAETA